MEPAIDELEAQLLERPESERARLAERLLQSLETGHESVAWVDEAERRHEAMVREGDPGIPADQVLDELAATLG